MWVVVVFDGERELEGRLLVGDSCFEEEEDGCGRCGNEDEWLSCV
jgi:hypothetical protein